MKELDVRFRCWKMIIRILVQEMKLLKIFARLEDEYVRVMFYREYKLRLRRRIPMSGIRIQGYGIIALE